MTKSGIPVYTAERKLLRTFSGVFTPTLLTILGVIMYVRLPWTVGNAGLLGGVLIILLANGITAATGLSLSSIATNTRVGSGGPYAIISSFLGFEVGGSIGFPLYLSQALAVAMYIFGFRERWLWIFPSHSPLVVNLAVFAVVLVVGYVRTSLAFKIQYVVMVVIMASLALVFGKVSVWGHVGVTPTLWRSYPGSLENHHSGTTFWAVFAVFFPAANGVLAGANMSGELRNLCRIENDAATRIMVGDFQSCVRQAPQSDMDILGLSSEPDLQFIDDMVQATRSSCMFVADSGHESALS